METKELIDNAFFLILVVGLIGTLTVDIMYIIRRKRQNGNRKPKPGTSAPSIGLKTKAKNFCSQMYRWVQTFQRGRIRHQSVNYESLILDYCLLLLLFSPIWGIIVTVLACAKLQTIKLKRRLDAEALLGYFESGRDGASVTLVNEAGEPSEQLPLGDVVPAILGQNRPVVYNPNPAPPIPPEA